MNKKHAYLIIAHHQFELLELLCRCLDHPLHDLYIHLDAKAMDYDLERLKSKLRFSNVSFTPERINCSWGGYSLVRAEMVLLKTAVSRGTYAYYHLISGVDMPLKSAQEIWEFFQANEGKEFVHFCSAEFSKHDAPYRVKYYHWLQEHVGNKQSTMYFVEKCLLRLQRILKINRLRNLPETIKCGSQWFSITENLAKHILQREAWIEKTFRYSSCSDELVVQTLVWNSSYRDQLYYPHEDGNYIGCVRYIDWDRGKPYTFCWSDFEELTADSGHMFARKFDYSKDPALCKKLAQWVMNRQQIDHVDSLP